MQLTTFSKLQTSPPVPFQSFVLWNSSSKLTEPQALSIDGDEKYFFKIKISSYNLNLAIGRGRAVVAHSTCTVRLACSMGHLSFFMCLLIAVYAIPFLIFTVGVPGKCLACLWDS